MKKLVLSILLYIVTSEVLAVCLKEGDEVTLSGMMKSQLFYGPPNYGENKESDQKLNYWILYPDKPIKCVEDADDSDKDWNESIQLIIMRDDYKTKAHLLNHKVVLKGNILIAFSGYHVTRILLDNTLFIEN